MKLVRVALASLLVAAGCQDPPRLDTTRANKHRAVVSPGVPLDQERELVASVDGVERPLAEWLDQVRGGETIDVKLGPGVYVIPDPIFVRGAALVIRGPGPDKTILKLDSEDPTALTVIDSPNFELRGVSVVGYSGGGVAAKHCARVVVNECDFASSRYGLDLESSTAVVDSCVFVGNERGIALKSSNLVVRGSAFADNWWAIDGVGNVDAFGCAFVQNEHGVKLRSAAASFQSCLFSRYERFKVTGAPLVRFCFLFDDLLEEFSEPSNADGNRLLQQVEQFPEALPGGFSKGMNLGAIHYALERLQTRGESGVADHARAVLEAQARRYAQGAVRALEAKDKDAARQLVKVSLDYVHAMGGKNEEIRKKVEAIVP